MNWLRRFLYGRNGPDQLALAVLAFGFLLTLIAMFVSVPIVRTVLQTLDYVCLAYFLFRVISRDLYRRRAENTRFLTAAQPLREQIGLRVRMVREHRVYKYLKCPKCSQRLRVPRGKGRILVSCQKCGERFQRTV